MRIGIFTDSYRPYTSGVVRSIDTFTAELTKLGHEIYIFAPNYPNCSKEEGVFRFPSFPAPTNRDFTLALPFSFRLKPTLTQWKPDIIHVHSPFLVGRVGARYARKFKIPLVFTFHTLYDQYVHYVPFARSVTRELTRRFCRDFCNKCDLVITPTSIIKDHLRNLGVYAKIKVIPTGINLDDFNNGDIYWLRKKYNIKPEETILLYVGRLGQEKNIVFLLYAFVELYITNPNIKLVLVGGGPEYNNLKKLTHQLGIEEQVIFTGTLNRKEVINCYLGADIFVFASKTETQGLVLAEAKAAGLPVVAIKAYGSSEMIKDGEDGFLLPESKEIYVEKIKELILNKELRQKLSRRAKINAQQLSSHRSALNLIAEYHALLNEKHDQILSNSINSI
ncbi:glycosyltransferase family 4 protein [Desulfofundulus thermocisternus]|uniref:glycosyltransferase family 4 protein n=1 Tax=Desulfofundulus thermocisternus TaxID=42471 RepID=UPI00217DDDF7|nr:glycosyltransferase family 4 protein [Desulfofundulus thermocisternus]MCS5695885.1 glycosyltransferase family 4 protein [Desulfofundulus thermocisternus]